MKELAHWDCWGWCSDRTVSQPAPSSTPEHAMELLLVGPYQGGRTSVWQKLVLRRPEKDGGSRS